MSKLSQHDRLSVVLVNTRNPLNLGAAARAMSNFGFFDLRVVNPYEASFREARSAVGAAEVLASAREFGNVAEAVADCGLVVGTTAAARRELQHRLHSLDRGAKEIARHLPSSRVALLFGSEKRGLSNHDLSFCHWLLRIPTREEHGSMNLGQAVAVSLYEIAGVIASARSSARSKNKLASSGTRNGRSNEKESKAAGIATSGQLELLSATLLDALRISGYLEPKPSAAADEKTRRLVRRLKLSADDTEILLGILRQMAWKMKAGKS